MTNSEKQIINEFRAQGYGYKKISTITGISVNTIKSFCKSHAINENFNNHCLLCGKGLEQVPNKKAKKFCSDKCRYTWWTKHRNNRKTEMPYVYTCEHCGIEFNDNRKGVRFCSRYCYDLHRTKEAHND